MSDKKGEKKTKEKKEPPTDTNPERKRIYDEISAIFNSAEKNFDELSQEQKDRYCTLCEEYKVLTMPPHITRSRQLIYNPPRFIKGGKKRMVKQLVVASAVSEQLDQMIRKNKELNPVRTRRQEEAKERELKAPLEQEAKQLRELNEQLTKENKERLSTAIVKIKEKKSVDLKKQPVEIHMKLVRAALSAASAMVPAIKEYKDYIMLITSVISQWDIFKGQLTKAQSSLGTWFSNAKKMLENGLSVGSLIGVYQTLTPNILGELSVFAENLPQDNPIVQRVATQTNKIYENIDALFDTPMNIKGVNLLQLLSSYSLTDDERFALNYMSNQFRNSDFVTGFIGNESLSEETKNYLSDVLNKLKQNTITPREIFELAQKMPPSLINSLKAYSETDKKEQKRITERKESKERISAPVFDPTQFTLSPSEPQQRTTPSMYAPIDITPDDIKTIQDSQKRSKKKSSKKTKKRTEQEQLKKDFRQHQERIRRRNEQRQFEEKTPPVISEPIGPIPTAEEVLENVNKIREADARGQVVFTEGPVPGVAPRMITTIESDPYKQIPLDFTIGPTKNIPKNIPKPPPRPPLKPPRRPPPQQPRRPPKRPPKRPQSLTPEQKDMLKKAGGSLLTGAALGGLASTTVEDDEQKPDEEQQPDEDQTPNEQKEEGLPPEMRQESEIARTETKRQLPSSDDLEGATKEILVNEVGKIKFRTREFQTRDLQDTLLMREPESLKAQLDPRVIKDKQERLIKEHMVPERETVEDVHVPGQLVDDDIEDDFYPDEENPLMQSNIEWQKDIYSGAYEDSIDGVLRSEIHNLQGKDYQAIDSNLPTYKHAKTTEPVTWDPMELFPYDDMSRLAPADVLDNLESYLQQDEFSFKDEPYNEEGFPRISQIQVYQPWKDVSEHTRTDVDDMPMSEIIPRRGYERWAEHDAMNLNNDIYTRTINAF